jgi:hypothetical protein
MRRAVGPALFVLMAGCSPSAPEPQQATTAELTPAVESKPQVDLPQPIDAPAVLPPQEPNDERATATPLTLGLPVQGYISTGDDPTQGDQDWFVVTIPGDGPTVLSAALKGPSDLDVVLEWMAPAPRTNKDKALIQADVVRKRPGDELLANLRVSPGHVYLRVRSAWYRNKPRTGSAEPYTLTADVLPWAATIEAEPNEVIDDAIIGTFERSARGTLGHIRDRDLWRIPVTAPPGTRLQLNVSGLTGVTMEASVYWLAEPRNVIRTKTRKGEGLTLRNLSVPEAPEPSLVVLLHAIAGAAPRIAYDMQLNAEPPSDNTVEAEPNDTAHLATPIILGDELSGFLDRKNDQDYISINVSEATAARITLTPAMDTRATLQVMQPDGMTALTRQGASKGASVSALGFGFTPGRWLLRIQGNPPNAKQHYTLSVNAATAVTSEREPNDSAESATLQTLIPKTPVTGWIHPATDLDVWRVERSEEQGPGIVTFQVDPPQGMRLDVTLHTLEGEEVTGRRGLTSGQPGTFTHFLAPGRYTVRIAGSTEKSYADAPYTLRLLD